MGDEIQLMQDGVREWVQQTARRGKSGLRAVTPTVLLSLLCASAFGPLLMAGGVAGAGVAVLSSVGGGVLAEVVSDAVNRLRQHGKRRPPSRDDLEKEIAQQIQRILAGGDRHAEALRGEIASVLKEIDAGGTALRAAMEQANDRVRRDVIDAIAVLGSDFTEMGFLLKDVARAAAEIQKSLDAQSADVRAIIEQNARQSADIRLVREELAAIAGGTAAGAPVGVRQADKGARWVRGCPYRGLLPFDESDADVFYGRERLAAELAVKLAARTTSGGLVVVTGASGAGKSSLLRAGLLPLLARGQQVQGSDRWPRLVMTPTKDPLTELAARLAALGGADTVLARDGLAQHPDQGHLAVWPAVLAATARSHEAPPTSAGGTARLVIIVDQFEQVFTLNPGPDGEAARRAFITALCAAATNPVGPMHEPPAVVVIAVRGDFWDQCAAYPELKDALQDGQFIVGPMTESELRVAITGPADAAGLHIDPALTDTILSDLHAVGTDDTSGVLPLLSQAMSLAWERREGDRLTSHGYAQVGGVAHAVQTGADKTCDALSAGQQALTRDVFRSMTVASRDGRLARRPVTRNDLYTGLSRAARSDIDAILDAFATERLVVLDGGTAQIAHDVLLRAWPRLRGWLEEDQASWILYGKLADAADAWHDTHGDPSFLYRGTPLTALQDAVARWSENPGRYPALTRNQRIFLEASERTVTRRTRRRRAVIAVVCVLALAVVSIGAVSARLNNDTARAAAITRANNLAAAAAAAEPSDPGLAGQLAVAAYRTSPTQAAVTQLYATLNTPLDSMVENTGNAVLQTATQADGPLAAVMDDNGSLRIWNTANPAAPILDTTVRTQASAIALAPRSGLMAAACPVAKALCLWSLADPRRPVPVSQLPDSFGAHTRAAVDSMAISPDGALLAAARENGQTFLWSIAQPTHPRLVTHFANPGRGTLHDLSAVAFAPRDHLLATTIQDGETEIWNLAHPATPSPVATMNTGYQAVAFSPGGTLLAAAGDTNTGLWSLHHTARPASINIDDSCSPSTSGILDFSTAAFSPDGGWLVFSGTDTLDGKGELCSLSLDSSNLNSSSPTVTGTLTGFGTRSMAYTASGALLTGGHDGTVRLWRWPLPQANGASPSFGSTWALSPNGNVMAASVGTTQGTPPLGIWNLMAPGGPTLDSKLQLPVPLQSVQFLSETALLTVANNGAVQLWNVRNPGHPVQAAALGTANFTIPGPGDVITSTGVTADAAGTLVTIKGSDNLLHLWHVNGALHASEIGSIRVPDATADYAGTLTGGRTVFILTPEGIDWWDITDPAHPKYSGTSPLNGANKGTAISAGNVFASTTTELATQGDLTLDVYDIADGKLLSTAELAGPVGSALGISNDGHLLAVTGPASNTITLWDTSNPKHPRTLAAVPAGQEVNQITFDPSDRLMADWDDSGPVQVWNITNPAAPVLEYTLTPPGGSDVTSAAFTQSGAVLAIAGDASTALFATNPAKITNRVCSYTGGTITEAQWTQFAPGIPYQNPCPS